MRANSSAAWAYFETLAFVAHPPGRLHDASFREFTRDLKAQTGVTGLVIVAGDGAPSPSERSEAQGWFREHPDARAAVLTNSVLARGAVTALSWFGVPMRAFSPEHARDGLDYVRLARAHHGQAMKLLDQLAERVQAQARFVARL